MLIKDIPYPKVRAAAIKKVEIEYPNTGFELMSDETELLETESEFWNAVHRAAWEEAKELCPHLFEEDPKVSLSQFSRKEIEEYLKELDRPKIYKTKFQKFERNRLREEFIYITCSKQYRPFESVSVDGDLYAMVNCERVIDDGIGDK